MDARLLAALALLIIIAGTETNPGPGSGQEVAPGADTVPGVSNRSARKTWGTVWQHRWTRDAHINLLEGHVLVRAAERCCSSLGRVGKQHLILTDSQAVLGAAQKGRSSSPSLNRVPRRLAALSLAYRQLFLFRWVGTKINPASEPSRNLPLPKGKARG